ncbi:Mrr restriction system protein [Providencia alcalifaciens Dmel2]|nr:Mrr restriction system protein [Providencia alcalifaciens Dmel2]
MAEKSMKGHDIWERLVNLMMDNEIGVSSQVIKLPKLDMDYFE